jgi:hypothetical protein
MTLVPFLVQRNSKLSLTTLFSCFCNWIRLVAEVRIIGGGLPVLPRTASSCAMASAPEESVSISVALRRAKIWVATSLRGWRVFTAALLFLKFGRSHRCCVAFASELLWNHPPGWIVVLRTCALVWPAGVFALSTALNSSKVTVYVS